MGPGATPGYFILYDPYWALPDTAMVMKNPPGNTMKASMPRMRSRALLHQVGHNIKSLPGAANIPIDQSKLTTPAPGRLADRVLLGRENGRYDHRSQ